MAKEYTLQSIEETYHGRDKEVPTWTVILDKGDGTVHMQIMPRAILEARAAEYDLDPHDLDSLWDIVIHGELNQMETDLFTAPTIADARDAHLARIESVRQEGISVTMPAAKARGRVNDPLAVVRNTYEPRAEVMNAYKREVANLRNALRKEA